MRRAASIVTYFPFRNVIFEKSVHAHFDGLISKRVFREAYLDEKRGRIGC